MFSGGALERLSIFAMGVMPYISASIIMQMLSMVVPSLMELRKEGESGKRKITQLTRYGTVILGVFQSFAAAVTLQNGGMVLTPGVFTWLFPATVTMTTGTMFLMWLGEQITERGVGNGISMIILVGIIAGLPGAVGRTIEQVNTGEMAGPIALPDRPPWSGHGLLRVRRARAAPDHGELRQAAGGASPDGRPVHAPAVQAEHGRRHSADLRLEPAAVPGDDRAASSAQTRTPPPAACCSGSRRRCRTASRCTWCFTAR
jgi:hypothetical protein